MNIICREDELFVAAMFVSIARLLAQPFTQDILELCELRNMLFLGTLTQNLRFMTQKDLRLPSSYYQQGVITLGSGFFTDYGRPNTAITAKEVINFWPDEWIKVLGGSKAIGHYIQVFLEKENVWREGKVTNYRSSDDSYSILLDLISKDTTESENIDKSLSVSTSSPGTEISVKLSSTRHIWTDSTNRHRLNVTPSSPKSRSQLNFSDSDIGSFFSMWTPKYQRDIYGRIINFDPRSKQHAIVFEDGEMREYDMSLKTYEILECTKEISSACDNAGRDYQSVAKIITKWHQRDANLENIGDNDKNRLAENNGDGGTTTPAPNDQSIIIRPQASQGFGLSYHHIDILNTYFSEGGSDSLFQLLSDTSRSPPSSKVLLLNLQFIYQMRHMLPTYAFRDIVWEIKEGVPFSLSRYDDPQFKDLTINELVDIFGLLRELIALTTNAEKGSIIDQQLDELRMTLALKLLRCSQIQKRYLGLSMIKEIIDTVAPKIAVLTAKKIQYLASTKNGRFSRDPSPVATKLAGTAPTSQRQFPGTTLSSNDVLQWLVKSKVVEEIFGSSIHQDLASKSDLILVFMAHRKVLTENHTEIIWQSCRGAHEAVVKVVHQLIMLIVPFLESGLRMKFFSQISSVPVKEYNESLLYLIKSYTVQALSKIKEENNTAITGSIDSSKSNMTASNAYEATTHTSAPRPGDDISATTSFSDGQLSNFSLGRKGLVVSAPPRQWMGFGVLWQFIQDPIISSFENQKSTSYVEDSLFDLAIQLLVELLQSEFMDEREKAMQRCLEHIRVGISVPASLQLLRKTLATYAASSKSWFGVSRTNNPKIPTISGQIEKFQKQEKLLDVLFMDIERYHKSMIEQVNKSPSTGNLMELAASVDNTNKNSKPINSRPTTVNPNRLKVLPSDSNPINDTRLLMNGKISRTSHIKGVSERLDFLKFVLSRSSLALSSNQMMILWRAFGEGAVTIETFEKLVEWLDSLIVRESKLYSTLLQSLAQDCDPINPNMPSKLAFLWSDPNSSGNANNSSRSDSTDGIDEISASAFEDNVLVHLFEQEMAKWLAQKDKLEFLSRPTVATLCIKMFLLVNLSNRALRVEPDGVWFRMGPLSGLAVIWRLALDSTDLKVSEAAITLIVELHHRTPPKFKGANQIRSYLMRICFIQLSTAVQSLRIEDVHATSTHEFVAPALIHAESARGFSPNGNSSSRRRSKTAGEELKRSQSSRVVIDGEGYPVTLQIGAPTTIHRFPDTPAIAIAPGSDDWYDDGDGLMDSSVIATRISRLISLMRLFIQRFQKVPTQIFTIKVLAGREETIAVTISMLSSETIGALRQKVASHFKEPANIITLTRSSRPSSSSSIVSRNTVAPSAAAAAAASIGNMWSSATAERLEKDDLTLKQAKFQPLDSVIARKKDLVPATGATSSLINVSDATTHPDFISQNDLLSNILDVLKPVSWLSVTSPLHVSTSNNTSSPRTGPAATESSTDIFTEPYYPVQRRIEANFWVSESSSFAGNMLISEQSTDGSDTSDYLGQYLKKSPHHIDQLLEMLDGYLSTEILKTVPLTVSDSSNNATSDISSVIWDVIQSLPVHADLLHQVKDLMNDSSGSSIRRLLDISSPYRFLYTLQIVDNLLDSARAMAVSTVSSKLPSVDNFSSPSQFAATSKQITKVAFDWSIKFLFYGGGEHIVHLLNQLMTSLLQSDNQTQSDKPVGDVSDDHSSYASSAPSSPTKQEAYTTNSDSTIMTVTMMIRILHRILLLDPLYDKWQFNQRLVTSAAMDLIFGGNHQKIPPGIALAYIDIKSLCHKILDYVCMSGRRAGPYQSSSLLQSLAENSLSLVFGLTSSQDDGFEILKSYNFGLMQWFKSFCLDNIHSSVRLGTCRRVFEACANSLLLSNDNSIITEEKDSRTKLMNFIVESIVSCSPYGRDSHAVYQAEQLYTLIAVLICIQYCPLLIFPSEIPSKRKISYESHSKVISSSPSEVSNIRKFAAESTLTTRFRDLYSFFVTTLASHKSSESFHSYESDGTMIGLLRALLVLVSCDSQIDLNQMISASTSRSASDQTLKSLAQSLIDHLYIKCLFPPDYLSSSSISSRESSIDMGAACQVWESRNLAYAILYQLCRHNEDNLRALSEIISGYYSVSSSSPIDNSFKQNQSIAVNLQRRKHLHWGYNPNSLAKDYDAYVGLVNQGGTCYMNSFLQQLFHVPEFCNAILRVDTSSKNEYTGPSTSMLSNASVDEEDQSNDTDIFVFQLQVLFGYLRLSQKKYYDTLSFCKSFKDYDGQPISLIEQKDINEFAGMLFDKLEANADCKRALENIIQGKVVYKTKSLESSYRSEREESFYMITAEVKGKSSLLDSLDLLVAEELFSGDNKIEDEEAGRKVDAIRRCTIRDLPNTLIIHLKRFEFDLETMDRKKVNDFITFPTELDMFPYTEEGISMRELRLQNAASHTRPEATSQDNASISNDDSKLQPSEIDDVKQKSSSRRPEDYYRYNLVGVVAHVGAIDRGHYYSFIKERRSQKWYQFNDRNVFPFSADAIPNECFGGEENVISPQGGQVTRMKQNNAYLLLYERINSTSNTDKLTLDAIAEESKTIATEALSTYKQGVVNNQLDNYYSSSETHTVKVATGNSEQTQKVAKVSKSRDVTPSRSGHKDSIGSRTVGSKSPVKGTSDPKDKSRSTSVSKLKSHDLKIDVNVDSTSSSVQKQSPSSLQKSQPSSPAPSPRSDKRNDADDSIATRDSSNAWRLTDMSRRVLKAVWSENTDFQTDRYLYSNNHFRFMWQLLVSPSFNAMVTAASLRDGKFQPVVASVLLSDGPLDEHFKADYVENVAFHRNSSSLNSSKDDFDPSYHSSLPFNPTVSPTLETFTLLSLKFTLEVVCTARAIQCIPIFFDKIFDIINTDSTGKCSLVILSELSIMGKNPCLAQRYYDPHYYMMDSKKRSSTREATANSPRASNTQSSIKKSSQDLEFINDYVHPWLIMMFVHCPIVPAVRAFSKLIYTCIKKVRRKQLDLYISPSDPAMSLKAVSITPSSPTSDSDTEIMESKIPSMEELENSKSCVTIVVNKFLILSERMPIEDAIIRDGFHMLGDLLYHIATLGYEERVMLIKLKTLYRVVCGLLSLSSSANRIPAGDLAPFIGKKIFKF